METRCQKCGTPAAADQAFCSRCGAVLGMVDTSGGASPELAATMVGKKLPTSPPPAPRPVTRPPTPGPPAPPPTPPPARGGNTVLILVAVGFVLVLLVGTLVLLFFLFGGV